MPQGGNVGRVVLAVAVEGRDPPALRRPDPAADRGALAAGGGMPHQPQPRQRYLKAADFGGGHIRAAVIDIDDLVINEAVERGGNLGDQRGDIAGLVLDRNDDRKIHARDKATPRSARPDSPQAGGAKT